MTSSSPRPSAPLAPATTITVAGTGWAVPETRVSNHHLAGMLDTSDDWITTRTGIRERRIATPVESTGTLAAQAARGALADACLAPDDLDLVVVATCTSETPMPSTAAFLAAELGTSAGSFDLDAACAGFAYAVVVAASLLGSGAGRHALVVGADTMSRVVDPTDRATAVLFGDGAGAVVVRAGGASGGGILATDLVTDRGGHGLLGIEAGGSRTPASVATLAEGDHYLRMDGRELFRRAVREVSASVARVLRRVELSVEDVSWFVPHQANARIVAAVAERTGLDPARVLGSGEVYGNTSAASIPLALATASRDGRIASGDRLLVSGFGAGLSVATLLWDWVVA